MKSSRLSRALRSHPLIRFLADSQGNPKILLLLEPLWGIPHSLIAPFAARYMYVQGVTLEEIGLIASIFMIVQVVFSFAGGILSDKWGRKTTTIFGDLLGWSLACVIWAFAGNFWLFLIAVLINSFEQVNQTAWYCLLIEDAEEKSLMRVYTWVHVGGLVAVFFAPISGVLVGRFSLVPVVRVLYLSFALTMLLKSWITYRHTTETKQGQIRMAQTKTVPMRKLVYEYRGLIPQIFRSPETLKIMAVSVLLYITGVINTNFFGLYIPNYLGLPEATLAVFPILNAVVMLVFMFAVQHRLEHVRHKTLMWIGIAMHAASQVLLVMIPSGNLLPVFLYTFLSAVGNALVMPRKDTLLALSIDPKERARILALITSFTIAFSSPFGWLSGILSGLDQRLPFVFAGVLFLLAIGIVGSVREGAPEGAEADSCAL